MDDVRRREEESSLRGYEHEFERAAEELRAAVVSKKAFVSDAQKIKLYSLFKQATEGDCAKPQPSAFQPVERAKWNGWQSLQGMAVTVAKRRYVLQVIELAPSFKMPTEEQKQQSEPQEEEAHAASAMPASDPEPIAPAQSVAQAPPSSPQRQRQPTASAPSQRRPPQASTRPRQQQQQQVLRLPPRQRLKQPVAASSYGAILLQLLLFAAFIGGLLFIATRVAPPLVLDLIAQHFGDESSRALIKSLTPVFWFALGYLFVAAIRSRIFSWRLLSGEFVWLNLASPRANLRSRTTSRQQQQRRRKRAGHRDTEQPKSPTTLLLEKFGIQLVEEASENDSSNMIVPRLELTLAENPNAMCFGDSLTAFPFPLEQTAEVYYRKFKEPLPDLASPSPSLLAITVVEEHELPEFGAVFRRRKLQFRNNAPYLIKRQFASGDFVEYVEDSLLDKRNRIFYVYTKNESFQSFGTIEDYAVYRVSENNSQWTELSQGARLHITNSSIGFLRSKIESLASNSYTKNIPLTREYHQQRLVEEFGEPLGLPATDILEETTED